MCLLIGCSGVGKTMLLKRLNYCSNRGNYTDINEAPSTIPTVGTNLVNIITSRKQEVTVRELGGCMAPIWHNYYKDCKCLMFMVDISNRVQISAACISFLEVLNDENVKGIPILLVLNKIDVPSAMKRTEFESIVRLSDIIGHCSQTVTTLEVSARDGRGVADIARWVQDNTRS